MVCLLPAWTFPEPALLMEQVPFCQPLGRHAHLVLAWKEGFRSPGGGLAVSERAQSAGLQASHLQMVGKRARPGAGFPLGPQLILAIASSSSVCLGPLRPPAPPLIHPILSFITTAREFLNCLLFLALRMRERSLPDSGAPLLLRGPRGDSICSVSCPAQPPPCSFPDSQ